MKDPSSSIEALNIRQGVLPLLVQTSKISRNPGSKPSPCGRFVYYFYLLQDHRIMDCAFSCIILPVFSPALMTGWAPTETEVICRPSLLSSSSPPLFFSSFSSSLLHPPPTHFIRKSRDIVSDVSLSTFPLPNRIGSHVSLNPPVASPTCTTHHH